MGSCKQAVMGLESQSLSAWVTKITGFIQASMSKIQGLFKDI